MKNELGKSFQFHLAACLCRLPFVTERLQALIDPDMFDDPMLGDIVAVAKRHFKESGELLTLNSLRDSFTDNKPVRVLLKKIFSEDVRDPNYVIDRVVKFAKQKSVEEAIVRASKMIADSKHDGIVMLLQDALSVGDDFSNVGEYLKKDFVQRKKEYLNPSLVERVPTGILLLDECLHGGQDTGTLGVFFGPPKSGKSTVLVNVGCGAACGLDGLNVVHYTLELKARSVLKMYDKRIVGRKNAALLEDDPRSFIQRVWKSHKRVVPHGEILVKGFQTRQATPSMIRSHLSMLKSIDFNPGLFIVDYADIMKAERRLGEFRHEQASIYEDLRAIAQEFNIPCWTGSQANRGSVDKDIVTIADLAEAFEKAAIADTLVAICRSSTEKAEQKGRLFLAAVREKEDGRIVHCTFDMRNCLVTGLSVRLPSYPKRKRTDKDEEMDEAEAEASVMRDMKE